MENELLTREDVCDVQMSEAGENLFSYDVTFTRKQGCHAPILAPVLTQCLR